MYRFHSSGLSSVSMLDCHKAQEDKTLRIKDTSGLHINRVRPSHSFTPRGPPRGPGRRGLKPSFLFAKQTIFFARCLLGLKQRLFKTLARDVSLIHMSYIYIFFLGRGPGRTELAKRNSLRRLHASDAQT